MDLTGRRRTNAPGFVYVLTNAARPGVVKIGSSKNPDKRLREFNIVDPYRSYEFAAVRFFKKGYYEAEKALHRLLARVRLDGEWFALPARKAVGALDRVHHRGSRRSSPHHHPERNSKR